MKSHLLALYRAHFAADPAAMLDIRADGSNRSLFRLVAADGSSVVGVIGPDHEENRAFLSYSRSLRGAGLPVPAIHAADEAAGVYIEEDLGDTTLFDALTTSRSGHDVPDAMVREYERVVELLPRVQVIGGTVIDFSVAHPCSEFDRQSMMWDLSYFKYHFAKLARVRFNEARLEEDFARLADFLLAADRSHFLYRDFQSRNIMLRADGPWLIDYQGGRRGALQYDIASLLYDSKAALPEALRHELLDRYLVALGGLTPVEDASFRRLYRGYVLIRILQAMGAYGYRGFFERKPHFLASVPYAIANIERLLEEGLPIELPELRLVLERIAEQDFSGLQDITAAAPPLHTGGEDAGPSLVSLAHTIAAGAARGATDAVRGATGDDAERTLSIEITSFSYKQGYPADITGHGGGFVFDCRFLHNPGRYAEYAEATGRDAGVIEFLERDPAVAEFWEHVRTMVGNAVEVYRARGFTHLAVSFGCTGGQHRSVYFAERLAAHVAAAYRDVDVHVRHREQERWPVPQTAAP